MVLYVADNMIGILAGYQLLKTPVAYLATAGNMSCGIVGNKTVNI